MGSFSRRCKNAREALNKLSFRPKGEILNLPATNKTWAREISPFGRNDRKGLNQTFLGTFTLALVLLLATAVEANEFKTAGLHPRLVGQTIEFSGGYELALTPKIEEALLKGIPIEIMIQMRLYRERRVFWNARVVSWEHRREIRYHALSGQYLVAYRGDDPPSRESFASLPEALRHAGVLDDTRHVLAKTTGKNLILKAHAVLNIEALPAVLRPVAYASMAWRLDSGWNTWTVAR